MELSLQTSRSAFIIGVNEFILKIIAKPTEFAYLEYTVINVNIVLCFMLLLYITVIYFFLLVNVYAIFVCANKDIIIICDEKHC